MGAAGSKWECADVGPALPKGTYGKQEGTPVCTPRLCEPTRSQGEEWSLDLGCRTRVWEPSFLGYLDVVRTGNWATALKSAGTLGQQRPSVPD